MLPTAQESYVKVSAYDDDDKWEFGGGRGNPPPLPVRRSIGDGNEDQQALVSLIVEHNIIACKAHDRVTTVT